MKITKSVTKQVNEVVDIICDKCGRSCLGKTCKNFCGISFLVGGNFDSVKFPDNEEDEIYDVCEFCASEWIKTFMPKTNDTNC